MRGAHFFHCNTFSLLQALEAIEKALKNADSDLRNDFIQLKFNTETVLASLYIVQEKSEKAMSILERHLQQAPNNTDIYNYARALFQLKRYNESVEYCNRALFLAEDESSLSLLAENYYCMKNYDLAAKTYREALAFLEKDNRTLIYIDANNKPLISWQKDVWHEWWFRKIIGNLVPSYCIIQDYVSAKVFRDLALSKYSDMESLQMWGPIIDKQDELSEKYHDICNQFELEKKMAAERTNKIRQWAQSLMQSQKSNFCTTIDLDNEENWGNFAQAVDSIIENMKNENGNNSQQYDDILRQTQRKYPRLEQNSIDFLTTAEYLYSVHKGIRMDFAPIMVEYCKVIEYELKKILGIFLANRMELRFVDMIDLVRRNNINKLGNIADKLDKIRHLRNGSAHIGFSTEAKVLKVRQLLFDDEIINKLCSGKA
jgi:tetratricopeptide (TPR) repeat protein